MKIVYQGDIHLRDTPPSSRIDTDYVTTQFDKLRQLVGFANEHKAILALGGDLFDTYKVSPWLVANCMDILQEVEMPVISAMGQHDVPYHQMTLSKSPLLFLKRSGVIDQAGSGVYVYMNNELYRKPREIRFHVVDWEQEVPKPEPEVMNILLGHISVFPDKVPFYWKGEGYSALDLQKKYPGFDYYLCGDIHSPFTKNSVVVSGSMMRLSIDQEKYKPRCYLIDTDTGKITPLFYQISKNVFVERKKDKYQIELNFEALKDAMRESSRLKNTYERDCKALVKGNDELTKLMGDVFDEMNTGT